MVEGSVTTMDIKKVNRNHVYSYIYNNKSTCKLLITQNLQMGLSTVTQNLKWLEEAGLVVKNGFFQSTGGRKADALEINPMAGIGVSVIIDKNSVQLVAIDLYGEVVCCGESSIEYNHHYGYYKAVMGNLEKFLADNKIKAKHILGVSIVTQGIVSEDGKAISYGGSLGNQHMTLDDFSGLCKYPCRLEHSGKAVARLELWKDRELKNATIIVLDHHISSAVVAGGVLQQGDNMRCGCIEHMHVGGDDVCFCGKAGCFQTRCSAGALLTKTESTAENFFDMLRKNDMISAIVWKEYLDDLAHGVGNVRCILDGKILLSGKLSQYFGEADLRYVLDKINSGSVFSMETGDLTIVDYHNSSPGIGAGLWFVQDFLGNVGK